MALSDLYTNCQFLLRWIHVIARINHYGAINIVTAVIAIGLGLAAIWCAYKTAPTVGKSI